ncbi:FecR family protein [Echinicola shivajiensis]|uniref:FecR family protein n=1 Tax=Echinicola shivajiensis TaxID=1035916 RepID=UPI001BFC7591|nr:FecR family protein [Echinicola shivajiensis]
MKYVNYDIEDFLTDEFFVKWVKSPDEDTEHFWRKWLENHPEKINVVLKASDIIQSVNYRAEVKISDADYTEMYEDIIRAEPERIIKSRKIYTGWIKNIAAAILVGACLILSYNIINIPEKVEEVKPELVTKSNPSGRKSIISLSDGTTIHLNSESSLTFPKTFGDSIREVELQGEAFFDVAEDKEKPFIIHSKDVQIKVLGTSFNVNQSEKLEVALVTGKVAIEDDLGNKIMLAPKEMLTMEEKGTFNKSIFDPMKVIGWKDKYLVFKKDSWEDVKKKIEKWYGMKIYGGDIFPKEWSYTGIYHQETIERVMEGIGITSNFNYEIKGNTITIKNPK